MFRTDIKYRINSILRSINLVQFVFSIFRNEPQYVVKNGDVWYASSIILRWLRCQSISFDITERLVGGAAYDKEGDSISDSTMEEALQADNTKGWFTSDADGT